MKTIAAAIVHSEIRFGVRIVLMRASVRTVTIARPDLAQTPSTTPRTVRGVIGKVRQGRARHGRERRKVAGSVRLDPRDARLDAEEIAQWGGDRYLPRPLVLLRDDPWRTSAWARSFSSQLLGLVDEPMKLATAMQDKRGCGVRTGLVFDPLRDEKAALARDGDGALAAALAATTGRPAAEFRTAEYDRVPPATRNAAALLLRAERRADGYRRRALVPAVEALGRPAPEKLRAEALDAALETLAEGGKDDEWLVDPDRVRLLETLADRIDWGSLNTGATIVAAAAKEALAIARAAGPPRPACRSACSWISAGTIATSRRARIPRIRPTVRSRRSGPASSATARSWTRRETTSTRAPT
jgi:hypothetical protein